jgi:thiol:disulfide interchange protein DsbD
MLPALFKGPDGTASRPNGAVFAWVDAFLLPEPKAPPRPGTAGADKELHWDTDLKDAVDRSRDEELRTGKAKPIFLDFTGVTCSNCRLNERNVFPIPAVRELLLDYERVQLYTDEIPEVLYATDPGYTARRREAQANDAFKLHKDVFGTQQLPLYAVLLPRPNGKIQVVGVYPEGAINKPNEFIAFLKAGLDAAKK